LSLREEKKNKGKEKGRRRMGGAKIKDVLAQKSLGIILDF